MLGTKVENPNTQIFLKEVIYIMEETNKTKQKRMIMGLVKDKHISTDRENQW